MARKTLFIALATLVSLPNIALAAGASSNRAYLGRPVDPGFGFQDLQNRWYDPATQRFLSLDPVFWEIGKGTPDSKRALSSSQAQNPTSYASGNPVRYSDPEGRAIGVDDAFWDPAWVAVDAVRVAAAQTQAQRQAAQEDLALDAIALATPAPAIAGPARTGRALASHADDAVKIGREVVEQGRAALKVAGENVGKAAGDLSKQAEKAIRSYEKRIAEHERKLEAFQKQPTPRPGTESLPAEVQQKTIAGRIQHLRKEIQTFRKNVQKILDKIKPS